MLWQPVIDPLTQRYTKGLDPSKLYRFRRHGSDEVRSFRLSETSPYFNVAGLYWRDPFKPRDSDRA